MTSKRDRLRAALAGDVADRPPVALWRHFPVDDQSPETLAAAVAAFQQDFDFDFVKVTPASTYGVRDWGVTDEWRGSTEGTREVVGRRVHQASDWEALEPLDPHAGSLGQHLEALRLIVRAQAGDAPVVATIFSPLAQAKHLAGPQALRQHLASDPRRVEAGLEIIARTTLHFLQAAREAGIEGVFYAVQHASPAHFDRESYDRFGARYDRAILEAASGLWLNILHLHGEEVYFDLAASLPADVVNWHDREAGPSLRDGRARAGRAVCGGLAREQTLLLGDPARVRSEAAAALRETDGGRGLILGTGCVVPIHAPRANLMAARRSIEAPADRAAPAR